VATASSHLLTVLGPAGAGKTRLVTGPWPAWRGRPCCAAAACPTARASPTAGGRDRPPGAGIADTGTAGARARLRRLLGTGEDSERVAARVAQLIGLDAAPAPAEEAAWAFRRLLELLAGRGPLVVVLDDLHWAEPGLLDLVEHVADYGRGAPILLVAMARPEFLEDRPGWAGGKLNATTLLLEPLGDAEATQLLAAWPAR
jgi:hypothetical protein